MEHKYTNRLIHEVSPYLLEHAHNPVDWYPWGQEAISRAKKEDKPILLSIGYSSCHWCHVMRKECFENESIAKIMNEHFVNIKVDREERPDLDEIYINAVQLMTGSGGWPLTVFLTPNLVPFHGGTYFPPEDRGGRIGFPKLLLIISEYYQTHRKEVEKMEIQMKDTLQKIFDIAPTKRSLDRSVIMKAYNFFENRFDSLNGGFDKAPKFPNPTILSFLLRYWEKTGNQKALHMVEFTLDRMARGGIRDHLGGGFHRYSVDDRWMIPHFEKMLYDNALLSKIYFETYQATKKRAFLEVGEEILNYILREMTSFEGGFFSAQDADTEGQEGKFFLWTKDQIKDLLGNEKGTIFSAYFGVASKGNFEKGANILYIANPPEKVSKLYGISIPDLNQLIEEGRRILFLEREKRIKPRVDEKIITSWNGLMISGFVEGFKVTGNKLFLDIARRAENFITEQMAKVGYLPRIFIHGKNVGKGFSEDYAFFIQALLDLYEVTSEAKYLKVAQEMNEKMIKQFWDDQNGGFFFNGTENELLIARSKNPYDHVIPSANSVSIFNLLRLAYLRGDESLKKRAEKILMLFYNMLSEYPSGFSHMLAGLSLFLNIMEKN